jgi:ABC-type nitrate/sulfonate/bicarbonate transport system substrate-binding protein
MVAALMNNSIDAASITAPADNRAIAQGFRYLLFGPDLQIAYSAANITTRRSVIAKRPQVAAAFMQSMAEASKILHTNKDFTFKVLAKHLGITDRKIIEAAYATEIKVMERRLEIKSDGVEAILEDVAKTEPRAKSIKPQDLIDRRYLDDMAKSGFFDRLWANK